MLIYAFSTLNTFIDYARWRRNLVRKITKFSNYKRRTSKLLYKHQVLDLFSPRRRSSLFQCFSSGGNKHTIPFRRQRLDIDEMLPESSSSAHRGSSHPLPYVNDPYIIDIVKVTEDRVAELEVQLHDQKQQTDEMETKMNNLKYQVRDSLDKH